MKKTINIIGAGRLGKTLGHLFVREDILQVLGVFNFSEESAKKAVSFIGEGQSFAEIALLPPADITLIATPDDKIIEASVLMAKFQDIRLGNIFFHCSGVLTSDAIAALKKKGGYCASIHPMKSFSDPMIAVTNYQGTYCAMEGDREAIAILEPIFKAIGSITYLIEKSKKLTYHAAGVFASNYVVTLFHEAMACLLESDVEEEMALQIVASLMEDTLTNIVKTKHLKMALTGPIKRGDTETIQKHLSVLPEMRSSLYGMLGLRTLELTLHDDETKTKIENIFTGLKGK